MRSSFLRCSLPYLKGWRSTFWVPVPLDRTRQKERGFNQVDLFGRRLASHLGLPYHPVLLKGEHPRPERHLLHFEERWGAAGGAFVIREGGRVDNLRILLLDDVMTLGAMLGACSRSGKPPRSEKVLSLRGAR